MACCTLCMGLMLVWSVVAHCDVYNGYSIIAAIIVSLMGGSISIVSLSLLLGYISRKVIMPNMSYCRFENTANDLGDCVKAIQNGETTDLSQYEVQGLANLFEYCSASWTTSPTSRT